MSTIFLSYARDDATRVQALASDLRVLGHTVWFDEEVSGESREMLGQIAKLR